MRIITETELIKYTDTKYDILVLNKKIEDFKKPIDKNNSNNYNISNYYRVKRKVRELCFCNNFDYFCTLTISPNTCNRDDLSKIVSLIRVHLKKYKRKNKDFSYILIPELHKDKKNYHFHGLMKGININDIYTNKNNYLSCKFFDFLGFNSFDKIKNYDKCCTYITKYITKDLIKTNSGHSYFHSRGLKIAERYKLKNFDIDFLKKYNFFENDYLKKINISNIDNLKTKDLYKLINILNESEDLYSWKDLF